MHASADAGSSPELRYRLGDWVVDFATGELVADDRSTALQPTDAAVLKLLVERAGAVVSKTELLDVVWADTYVADDAVWQSVSRIRRALGDRSRQPRYIETLPRRGYRLAVEAVPLRPSAAPDSARDRVETAAFSLRQGLTVLVIVGIGLTGALLVGARGGPADPPAGHVAGVPDAIRLAEDHLNSGTAAGAESAIRLLRAEVERDPQTARGHALLAMAIATKATTWSGGFELAVEATQHAQAALHLAPEDPETLAAVADMYALFKSPERGLALDIRSTRGPMTPEQADRRAMLLLHGGELAASLRLKRAFPLEGVASASDAHFASVVWGRLGDLEAALDSTGRALQVAPAFEPALALRIELLADLERWQAATTLAQDALDLNPDSPPTLNAAAYLARKQDKLIEAAALLKRSVGDSHDRQTNARGWLWYSEVLLQLGRVDQPRSIMAAVESGAFSLLDQRLEPASSRVALGMVAALRGDYERAVDWLRQAMALGYLDLRLVEYDAILAPMRESESYARLRAEMRAVAARERAKIQLAEDLTDDPR